MVSSVFAISVLFRIEAAARARQRNSGGSGCDTCHRAPAWSSEIRTAARTGAGERSSGLRGLAYLAVVIGLGWIVVQTSTPGSLQADAITLSKALSVAEGQRKSLLEEKGKWSETLRQAERLRDQYLRDFRETIVVLNRERDDHRATSERLATVQRELEAERARAARTSAPRP